MRTLSTWNDLYHLEQRWHELIHPARDRAQDPPPVRFRLFGLRLLSITAITGLWIYLVLSTGFFSVAMVILIGIGIGSVHRLLPRTMQRPHLPCALIMTLVGGVLANVFAGLAEFSYNVGVSYWQVLGARQFPEDFAMLGNAFVEAFRIQDLLYYLLALTATVVCTQIRPHQKKD